MGILAWLVFGLIVGSIANLLDPRPSKGGILGSIVLGIVGAIVGGFLGNMIFAVGIDFDLSSFLVAIAGSLLLLFVGRAMNRA